jgi:hypothetical protein
MKLRLLYTKTRDLPKKASAAKAILAEFKDDPSLNRVFHSLISLAKELEGDRVVIREYFKGTKSGYYRGKWKFSYLNPITEKSISNLTY